MKQLGLFAALEATAERPVWNYQRGLPDRSGMFRYTHLIQSKYDPDETMGRGRDRDPLHWKKIAGVEHFEQAIASLMADGEPRTFNAICVQITGTNGNVWFEKAPDQALWILVEKGLLAWTCTEGATFFLDSSRVEWGDQGQKDCHPEEHKENRHGNE